MKVTVDFDSCMSTGSCVQYAPEVFEIRDDGFLYVLIDEPQTELHEAVRSAADLCPTAAITLID